MNKMKKKVLMMTMAAVTLSAVAQQPVDYVNPIIGTNGMGHTFPVLAPLSDGYSSVRTQTQFHIM